MAKRYIVQWDYSSGLIQGGWKKGDKVDLDDDVAEAVNLDSPGVLVEESKTREVKAPAQDRQQKGASSRAKG